MYLFASASRQLVQVQALREGLRHQRPRLDRQEEKGSRRHHLLLRDVRLNRRLRKYWRKKMSNSEKKNAVNVSSEPIILTKNLKLLNSLCAFNLLAQRFKKTLFEANIQ